MLPACSVCHQVTGGNTSVAMWLSARIQRFQQLLSSTVLNDYRLELQLPSSALLWFVEALHMNEVGVARYVLYWMASKESSTPVWRMQCGSVYRVVVQQCSAGNICKYPNG